MNAQLRSYVPLLKAKEGETIALAELHSATRDLIMPFFDISRPNNVTPDHISSHIQKATLNIARRWGQRRPVYIDTFDLEPNARCTDGTHPIERFARSLISYGIETYPTVGLDRDKDHIDAVSKLLQDQIANRICIRLIYADGDLADPEFLVGQVAQALGQVGCEAESSDIVIDLRGIVDTALPRTKSDVFEAIAALQSAESAASIILAGTSFPNNLGIVPKDGTQKIDRHELSIWAETLAARSTESLIRFGDYGIVYPEFTEQFVGKHRNAKVRYAHGQAWTVYRGHSLAHTPAVSQYPVLCSNLVDDECFASSNESWGDRSIVRCARELEVPRDPTRWVAIDTNRHIEATGRLVSGVIAKRERGRVTISTN